MISLPIDEVLPALREALAQRHEAVLEAPPGAGKTTRVPLALLNAPWLAGQSIVMLEPRRLAARAAAERLASELGEKVGETVGYRIRLDSKVGPKTRIEVVTEGVFTRMILDDPGLDGVAAVLFDEFHERSLNADLGLALCLEVRGALREDLVDASKIPLATVRALAHTPGGAFGSCRYKLKSIEADRAKYERLIEVLREAAHAPRLIVYGDESRGDTESNTDRGGATPRPTRSAYSASSMSGQISSCRFRYSASYPGLTSNTHAYPGIYAPFQWLKQSRIATVSVITSSVSVAI